MKIKLERPNKNDRRYYLHIGDSFFHIVNDWSQVFSKYNWYTFHFLHLYMENDVMTCGFEVEIVILGLGFRWRWNYAFEESETGKRLKESGIEYDDEWNEMK